MSSKQQLAVRCRILLVSDSTVCPRLLLTLAAGRCRILLSLNSFKLEVSTTPEGPNLIDGLVTKTERTLDMTQEF